jgi:hypothetical protein
MLDRAYLDSNVSIIFKVKSHAKGGRPMRLHVWVMTDVSKQRVSGTVYLSTSRRLTSIAKGTPIDWNTGIVPLRVEPGETIYGTTEDEALLGMSIEPIDND